jgi:thiol-disulfide isomerase/thioredoxin
MRFERPEGGDLPMSSLRGKPLVLNFWATWCAPCLKELPQIDRFHRDFKPKGWQVLGLAMDGAAPVREFLAKLPLSFPIALGGMEGSDLVIELGNPQGMLPFTVVLDASGQRRWHKLGETHYEELAEQAQRF